MFAVMFKSNIIPDAKRGIVISGGGLAQQIQLTVY